MSKKLSPDVQEFVKLLTGSLPPVIARAEVPRLTGGLVAAKTLANADHAGKGPKVSYQVGRARVYRTDSLVEWFVDNLGVTRLVHMKDF